MRATDKELMDKLGVGYVLGPYESIPWFYTDAEKSATVHAEVRMGMDSEEVEATVQLLYDAPPEGQAPMETICEILAAPFSEGMWTVTDFKFRNAPYGKDVYDWEDKACIFFQGIVHALATESFPNFDELLDDAFHGHERFRDQRGGGGGKSPKIKPGAMLGIKKGGF
jgi:hypothetical protein